MEGGEAVDPVQGQDGSGADAVRETILYVQLSERAQLFLSRNQFVETIISNLINDVHDNFSQIAIYSIYHMQTNIP